MSTVLEFLPKIGFSDLRLGMSNIDCEKLLGKPNRISQKRNGKYAAVYDDFSITYSTSDKIVNIEVYSRSKVLYKGKDIFKERDARLELIKDDGAAKVISGTIVLLNLGLSMWEDENEEEANKTVVAFSDGEWDMLKDRMKDLNERGR